MLMRSMEDTQAEPAWFRGALDPWAMLEAALPLARRCPASRAPPGAERSASAWMDADRGGAAVVHSLCCLPINPHLCTHTRSHMQAEPAAAEPTTAEPAAAAAEAQTLALEQRCAKLEAELTALRARLHEAEARYRCHTAIGRHRGLETYRLLAQTPHMLATTPYMQAPYMQATRSA